MKFKHLWNLDELLNSPFFEPLHLILSRVNTDQFPSLADCNSLLDTLNSFIRVHRESPLKFVEQKTGKLTFEMQYEPLCYLKGEVQTRKDNWHDLLNALVWMTFPKTKAAINARHYAALIDAECSQKTSQRGTVRDMNTLFDESGVVVVCADPALSLLLLNFKWKELFWEKRKQVQSSMGFYLFGHGLYEKALNPYIGLTGQGLVLSVNSAFFDLSPELQMKHADDSVADYINNSSKCVSTRELTPVPLLGIPDWTPENNSPNFYDNTDYFRPARRSTIYCPSF
jgi:hypothetical protein